MRGECEWKMGLRANFLEGIYYEIPQLDALLRLVNVVITFMRGK